MNKIIDYFVCVGSALSQLAYQVLTGKGNSNLSISGEAYYNRHKRPWLYKLINKIFFFQDDHCKWAYDNDLFYADWYIQRDNERTDK